LNDPKGNINYKDESGWTALHYASDEGNLKIVDILLRTPVDLNCRTNNKKTPIHLSGNRGYFDISKLLVENGCLINLTDDEKNTVIHICSAFGHQELLKFLLEKFPEANSKNIYCQTPLMLAKKETVKTILKDYLKKNPSQFNKIHIHTTNEQSADILLKKTDRKFGNNFNTNDFQGRSISKRPTSKLKSPDIKPLGHNKYQSNDFKSQTNILHKNNINIKISTNIGGSTSNKQFKINEKVKVTVETKVDKNPINHASTPVYSSKKTQALQNSPVHNSYLTSSDKKKILNNTLTKCNTPISKFTTNHLMGNTTIDGTGNEQLKKLNSGLNININKVNLTHTSGFKDNKIGLNKTNTNPAVTSKKGNTTNTEETSKESDRNNTSNNLNIVHIDLTDPREALYDIEETGTKSNEMSSSIHSYSGDDEKIGPSSFICHALLGKGSFGEVYLVEKKNTGMLYAMKVLNKDRVTGQNLVKYAMTERNVLSITNHPFIVKLNYAFQTADKLFLILDYCPGGDLAEHLARENRFKEDRAKIYLCEIILALEDLHKRDIIFRDLKPDNVVLDMEGHALLTDFGLSKEGVFDSRGAKSFCG
jgi:ankyrin repeat protein